MFLLFKKSIKIDAMVSKKQKVARKQPCRIEFELSTALNRLVLLCNKWIWLKCKTLIAESGTLPMVRAHEHEKDLISLWSLIYCDFRTANVRLFFSNLFSCLHRCILLFSTYSLQKLLGFFFFQASFKITQR